MTYGTAVARGLLLFSLSKTSDNWILDYEVGFLRRLLLVGAGVAGIGVGAMQSAALPLKFEIPLILLCLAVIGYWVASDLPTTATFYLKERQVRVESQRPWFGRPRSFAFSEVTALYAVSRSSETTDSWEAILEVAGRRIKLGAEAEGRNEKVRQYLEEIRNATGIAGR